MEANDMSEIAEIRKRIDQEIEAMHRGLNGYAAVARHRKVEQGYDGIGQFIQNVTPIVGREVAIQIALEELERER
jgi:hypothetical protein